MSNPLLLFLIPLCALLLTGERYIAFLKQRYFGQYIREDGPQSHHSKAGTPTTGGVLILGAMLLGTAVAYVLVKPGPLTPAFWLVIGVTLILGVLGFSDDYLKISKKKNKGLSGYSKLAIQVLAGLGLGLYVVFVQHRSAIDVFHLASWDLGWFYPILAILILTGTSNAVNLTDGLDGLAVGSVSASLLALLLMLGSPAGAAYHYDLSLFAWILLGGTLGFWFFNRHPAKVFMGDSGSLALGGAIGALGILGGLELWLLLLGGLFVLEALSVMLQVASFKTTGKRIFKMSPLHHHFELSGWSEPKVVISFILFQFLLCLLALFLYNTGILS